MADSFCGRILPIHPSNVETYFRNYNNPYQTYTAVFLINVFSLSPYNHKSSEECFVNIVSLKFQQSGVPPSASWQCYIHQKWTDRLGIISWRCSKLLFVYVLQWKRSKVIATTWRQLVSQEKSVVWQRRSTCLVVHFRNNCLFGVPHLCDLVSRALHCTVYGDGRTKYGVIRVLTVP